MSSKRATYYYRNFNWQEVNNMFAYDVKFPDRLTKRQQILRLYKNTLRRVWDLEITGFKENDLHSYAEGCREVRLEFEALKNAKTMKEVENLQEKFENFIEDTYQVSPYVRDNVPYEWRHQKGLISFTSEQIEFDPHGYYSPNALDLYPKPREFEFRDEFPVEFNDRAESFTELGWEHIDESKDTVEKVSSSDSKDITHNVNSPEELKSYVEMLKKKIGKH